MIIFEKYRGDKIVVGLSGGADSVALFFALREAGAEVFAAHVNHGLRGDEAERDEQFVRNLCLNARAELKVERANVRKFAAERKLGIEEAARILRYEFLDRARIDFGAEKIAVGHNADDNAETVLMNLARGAGLRGLGGIPPARGRIIRPLLNVPRAEIEEYLKNVPFLTDSTNLSNDFTRNRVRNKILPAIEAEINPNARIAIARAAELLRADADFIETAAEEAFANCVAGDSRLCTKKLASLHPAISGRVARMAISRARGDEADITQAHVVAVLELATGQSGREVHLPGIIVAKEYDELVFHKNSEQEGFCYEMSQGTPVFIPETGKTFTASDTLPSPLFLRTRRPGDKITFKNADGKFFTKKLQDYFTDEKIPRRERDKIPLLAHGSEILRIFDKKGRVNAKFF
ncbi:MAG: tRNA lysidine(34) synthetase TilS [Defluviitaleaceae bacterium]|nr:tRNA lysidine(34) synthetase TilS [Defluviitaleaceae bacterium]